MEITVGQVSGAIAAAVFILQHVLPNAIVLILVSVLNNQSTAVTWSVVQRQISSTLWPVIFSSDSAASQGVDFKVIILTYLRPLALALVAVAAIVTPLGLHQATVADDHVTLVAFQHMQDEGPMGYGTPPQDGSVAFQRVCGGFGIQACPGTDNVVISTTDEDGFIEESNVIGIYNTTVPQASIDLYQSGLKDMPKTVSSFFDIRNRQYTYRTDWGINDDKIYPVENFRQLQTMILDDSISPIQGLIVDMVNGGVGFRRHTVPSGGDEGAEWTEDLLWIEPESACVNTNLSLQFSIADGQSLSAYNMQNVTLIDNGGFVDLIQEYPRLSMDDNQVNPKLRERAYKAAWLVNTYAALTLNVTRPSPDAFAYLNSERGKKFPLAGAYGGVASANGIYIDNSWDSLVNPDDNTVRTVNNTFSNTTTVQGLYENPFNISRANYTSISTLCQGVGGRDYANSSNILVQCGLFYSAAVRADGKTSLIFEPNTTWTQDVYSCATLNKASIKEVSFRYNATLGQSLKSLTITDVRGKEYNDTQPPLWGIEEPDPVMFLSGITQFWGVVSEENKSAANLSTKRAPELYLPGYSPSGGIAAGIPGYQYIPGASGHKTALSATYGITQVSTGIFDYTGATNLALFTRWQNLSQDEKTIPKILSLIWTDIAANAMQGMRGWDSSEPSTTRNIKRDTSASTPSQQSVPVKVYRKRIVYRWVYAIPALLALALSGLIVLAAIVASLFRAAPTKVRQYMNRLSAGRIFTAYEARSPADISREVWTAQYGRRQVMLQPKGSVVSTAPGAHYASPQDHKLNVTASTEEIGESYTMTPTRPQTRLNQGYVKVDNGAH